MQEIIKLVKKSEAENLTELEKELKKFNSRIEFEKTGKLNFVKLDTSKIIIGKSFNKWYVL